jgi:hypothetical protein
MNGPRRRLIRVGLALAGLGLVSGCGTLPTGARRTARLPRVGYLGSGGDRHGQDQREPTRDHLPGLARRVRVLAGRWSDITT